MVKYSMTNEHPTLFFSRVMRNLSTLRDIQKIIDDARQARGQTIEFVDEKGFIHETRIKGRVKQSNTAEEAGYLSRSDTKSQKGSGFQHGFTSDYPEG